MAGSFGSDPDLAAKACRHEIIYGMLLKTRGIIFRVKKYSETSVIIDVFTEEKGMRSYLVSGVRTQRARVSAGLMQVMSLVDIVAYHREDQDLTRLKEVRALHVFHGIPFDIRKGAIGTFMIEVARSAIHGHEEHPELFQFIFENFVFLDETAESASNLHLHFMLHLTEFLGFLPSEGMRASAPLFDLKEGLFVEAAPIGHPHWLSQSLSEKLEALLYLPKEACHSLPLSREERRTLLRSLLLFYKLHIENFPVIHSHEVLEEVLG